MPDKITSLNRNFQFRRAYKRSSGIVCPFFVAYIVKNKNYGMRLGITAGKKIGCAVERNRARRIVKAAAREIFSYADGCFDIVLVCRRKAVFAKSSELVPLMKKAFIKAGVISEGEDFNV